MDLRPIRDKLLQRVCAEHGVSPKITIFGNQLRIECCCEAFHCALLQELDALTYQTIKASMRKEIKKIWEGAAKDISPAKYTRED